MNVFQRFAALVAAAIAGVTVAQAQDYNVTQTSASRSPYEHRVADGHHAPVPAPAPHIAPPPGDHGCGYQLGHCDTCFDPCGPVCHVESGFFAGFEFVFMQPRVSQAGALTVATAPPVTLVPLATTGSFTFDYEVTPRIWFGYVGESGLGGRVRYWQFDHNAKQESIIAAPLLFGVGTPIGAGLANPAAANLVAANYGLELHTLDLETIYQFCAGNALVTVGGGLRYVDMTQQASAVELTLPNLALVQGTDVTRIFRGTGPTLAAELLAPIGGSGLSWYANARGSVIFGERDTVVRTFGAGNAGLTAVAAAPDARDTLAIGEVGIGVQYGFEGAFVRLGWEGQYWHNTGGPNAINSDLALQGLSIGLGLSY